MFEKTHGKFLVKIGSENRLNHNMKTVSFNLLPNCLGIAHKKPTTNGAIFAFTFQIFCNTLFRYQYFSIFSFSFSSILLSQEPQN